MHPDVGSSLCVTPVPMPASYPWYSQSPVRFFSLLVQLSIFDHLFLQSCHLSLCERDILKERIMNVCMKASALVFVET